MARVSNALALRTVSTECGLVLLLTSPWLPKKGRMPGGGHYVAESSATQKVGSDVMDNSHVQTNVGPKLEIGTLSEVTSCI